MPSQIKVDTITDSSGTTAPEFPNGASIDGNKLSGIPSYNYIVNGNFDIWQRGTSQTTSGYGSADRWSNLNIGSTKTASQQSFALGQTDVPDNPKHYMRHVVNSVAGANNYCAMQQRIEYVKTLAGKKATLSFWAKADALKNIAIEFAQDFGTGGTPSSAVVGIGSQLVALTTSWAKYTVTIDIPSIAGKTLGTSGNDCLICNFWFNAASAYAVRSANLGQQSGTFDIANVSLVEGDIDVKPIPRSYGEELGLCLLFTQLIRASIAFYSPRAGEFSSSPIIYHMRQPPSVTNIATIWSVNVSSVHYEHISKYGFRFTAVAVTTGNTPLIQDLLLDSEL